jgi:hypothetical protein
MISLNDFTPTELRTLAELMLAHNRAELHSVQSTHTGGPLPQRAVARYDRQHAVATALNVEADRRAAATAVPAKQVTATSRDAGRQVVHTVDAGGVPVIRATRRSATNRYRYAIVRWTTDTDGSRVVVVQRWSNSPKASGRDFAVAVEAI